MSAFQPPERLRARLQEEQRRYQELGRRLKANRRAQARVQKRLRDRERLEEEEQFLRWKRQQELLLIYRSIEELAAAGEMSEREALEFLPRIAGEQAEDPEWREARIRAALALVASGRLPAKEEEALTVQAIREGALFLGSSEVLWGLTRSARTSERALRRIARLSRDPSAPTALLANERARQDPVVQQVLARRGGEEEMPWLLPCLSAEMLLRLAEKLLCPRPQGRVRPRGPRNLARLLEGATPEQLSGFTPRDFARLLAHPLPELRLSAYRAMGRQREGAERKTSSA